MKGIRAQSDFQRSLRIVSWELSTCLRALMCVITYFGVVTAPNASASPQNNNRFEKVDEPDSGRLKDGRAYRTDGQGNQLVDYIAELEVNIQELNRQVHGLEDEVEKKQQKIDSLARSGAKIPELLEKDLGSEKSAANIQRSVPPSDTRAAARFLDAVPRAAGSQVCPTFNCPEIKCPGVGKGGESLGLPEIKCPAVSTDCAAISKEVRDELYQVRIDLAIEKQDRAKTASELSAAKLQIEELNKHHGAGDSRLSDELASKDAELEKVKFVLQSVSSELKNTKQQLAQLGSQSSQGRSSEQSSSSESQAGTAETVVSLSPAKQRALASVRGNLQTEVNSVRGLLSARESAYQRYSRNSTKFQYKPSQAVSSKGRDLNEVALSVKEAATVYDLMVLRAEITEIRGKIQQDLALMSRMSKIR